MNRHGRSRGPKSGPLDKSLGRKADPEGGKIYDKGSAWAGATHPNEQRIAHILANRRTQSEGPKSGPLDKSLGRKADPEGGKIYDKGSAWAGATHPNEQRIAHILANRRTQSEGPKSGPLDKSLGRKADPEGGKIHDKGSAWAGASARTKHLADNEREACISTMSAPQRISQITKDLTQRRSML